MIELTDKPTPEDIAAVRSPLRDFNVAAAGPHDYRPLAVLLRDEAGTVEGGLIGETMWRWLYVDLLFVPEALRGRGIGSDVLRRAEDEARNRGCGDSFLATFSFQAKPFYERHGYRQCGQADGFPPGHRQYFMTKRL
jgi:GNAT superfamily N-acetyltransferase